MPAEPPGPRRTAVALCFVALVVAAAAFAVYRERDAFADALRRIGAWPMAASLLIATVAVGLTFPTWRAVLAGLGVPLPWAFGARLYYTSQLGKYLPGAVWPVVAQMEAGRSRGASRRTMLSGNLLTIVLSCCIGLLVACVALPAWSPHALTHYWWVMLALPLLVTLLHPRALPTLLDKAFALLRRAPLNEQLPLRYTTRAAGWAVASWIGLGLHLYVLSAALGHGGVSAFALCTGGMALAVSAGVLFIPAPAGAGLREVVLVLVLGSIMTPGEALAVVVASRALLIAADLLLAAAAAAARSRRRPAATGVPDAGRHRARR